MTNNKNNINLVDEFRLKMSNLAATDVLTLENINNANVYHGIKAIYDKAVLESFNPLEEEVFFWGIFLNALYDFSFEEVSKISDEIGLFRMLFILENAFEDAPAKVFFRKLYNQYYERQTKTGYILEKAIKGMADKIDQLNIEDLKPLAQELNASIEKMVK